MVSLAELILACEMVIRRPQAALVCHSEAPFSQSHPGGGQVPVTPNVAVSSRGRAHASSRSARLQSWAATSIHGLALDRHQSMI